MHHESQTREEVTDSALPLPQLTLIITKQQQIIHIAQITSTTELAFHKLIQLIEVDVGPDLAGKIADGEATRPLGGQQIIPGK